MKHSGKLIIICFTGLLILTFLYFMRECVTENMSIVFEDFEKYSDKDDIFNTWLLRDDNKKEASGIYKIVSENSNKFLSARSDGNSIQIAKKINWNIKAFPVLSWKWRDDYITEGG